MMSRRAASSGGFAAESSAAPAMSNQIAGQVRAEDAGDEEDRGGQVAAGRHPHPRLDGPRRTIESVTRPLTSVPITAAITSRSSTSETVAWPMW